MSKQDIKTLVQAYFDAFNARDVDALLALLHEDVVHDINQGSREIGKQAFRQHYAKAMVGLDEERTDVAIMTSENGNRAAAEFTRRGTYVQTMDGLPEAREQSYSLSAAIFFEMEDEKLSRITGYFNSNEFIKQLS